MENAWIFYGRIGSGKTDPALDPCPRFYPACFGFSQTGRCRAPDPAGWDEREEERIVLPWRRPPTDEENTLRGGGGRRIRLSDAPSFAARTPIFGIPAPTGMIRKVLAAIGEEYWAVRHVLIEVHWK
jgi:hypothetical protein